MLALVEKVPEIKIEDFFTGFSHSVPFHHTQPIGS